MKHRVVVTGMSGVTALGDTWQSVYRRLRAGDSAVRYMSEWRDIKGLNCLLGAPVDHFECTPSITRKHRRGMGSAAKMSATAAEAALLQADLLDHPVLTSGSSGVAFGSSSGSVEAIMEFGGVLTNRSLDSLTATSYVRMMPHTLAANLGLFFGLQGRVIPTSSACTSSSQAIVLATETIRHGYQDVMIAGGADELAVTHNAVFDLLYATSTKNDQPDKTPKPFDVERDGLVIGEGAGALVLESLEHALARDAVILAEIVGVATNSDGRHVTQPASTTMEKVMKMALSDSGLDPQQIAYVSAHATGTVTGDVAESRATERAVGSDTRVSSLKGYFGHTLGACGGIEAWLGIEMLNQGWFAPNRLLGTVDPQCGSLDYIKDPAGLELETDCFMSNNFAFGGVNTSIIVSKYSNRGHGLRGS